MQCSVYIAMSLDGFIARKDGSIDWLETAQKSGEDYGYARFHASIDTIVVGRKTYDQVLGFEPWPYAGKRCIVVTHRPPPSRHGEEFFGGAPAELVARLQREGTQRAYIDGGTVVQQFLAAGLIDDLTVSIIPVLLGEGIPLFGALGRDQPLRLVRAQSFQSGLAQLEYAVTREAR